MMYVFVNKENPRRIKMIDATNLSDAKIKLARRMVNDYKSGLVSDYVFGYRM